MIWTVLEMVVVEMTVVAEVRLLTPISCILVISHNEQAIMTRENIYTSPLVRDLRCGTLLLPTSDRWQA
jgi:hypothetical protein